jgi:hypothetical protein
MTRLLILFGLMCSLCASVMAAAPIPGADVVIIADESGSMSSTHFTWLASMITALETDYKNAGVGKQAAYPNQYALFGYGYLPPYDVGHPHGGWMNAAAQVANISTLATNGGTEDGYEAINAAMTTLTFRPGSYKTVILITDEDRDVVSALTRTSICQLLGAKDATLNSIVNASFAAGVSSALGVKWDGTAYIPTGGSNYISVPGGTFVAGFGTTLADYVQLSWGTCGSAWNLYQDSTNGASLTNAFTDVKVQELIPIVQTLGGQPCSNWILAMGCLLYSGGQECFYWFEYRELGSLTWKQSTIWYSAIEGRIFMDYIRDLNPGTWYQVRAVVQNAVMKAVGQDWCIQTRSADVTKCDPLLQKSSGSCGTACGCN